LSKKILLISGHGQGDSGAVGNGYKEANLTRELVDLLAIELKKYVNVEVYNKSRDAFKDVKNGNFNVGKYDYALEIHFNAFNGKAHGSEIYVTTRESGITVEQEIMKNMKKYFTLRGTDGVKREDFAVINTLKNKGISGALLEVCFIDSATDMKVYKNYKKDIAKDIVVGIAKGFGLLKPKTIEVGSTVKVSKDAVIGGLASNRGQKASSYLTSKEWEVKSLATHKGEKEALLSCNTWIAVKYLKAK
jgi:N-acetylmuramoyl-L-alanine amidase